MTDAEYEALKAEVAELKKRCDDTYDEYVWLADRYNEKFGELMNEEIRREPPSDDAPF